MALAVGFVTGAVLLLSAAGVHAMMSFTIAQRTLEIGIRSALGAQPRHLLLGILKGAMRQLALGIAARFAPLRPHLIVRSARSCPTSIGRSGADRLPFAMVTFIFMSVAMRCVCPSAEMSITVFEVWSTLPYGTT